MEITEEKFKEGQFVVISGNATVIDRIAKIERSTKTMVMAAGYKFNRESGRLVGGGAWSSLGIKPATQEDIERIRKESRLRKICNVLHGTKWKELPLWKLENIHDIVTAQ